jgi:Terminase large subunit, T4likevirus-type, N-terminal
MSNNAPQLVKPAHGKTVFNTQKELEEFVKCCDPDTGYEYFMDNFFMIQHPTRGGIHYHPYKYQRGLIDSFHRYNRIICLLPRQSGKSTSAAGYLLWYAMFNPDATVLIAAHKFSGAQEIMQRVRHSYEACPHHIKAGVTSYNKGSIEFENGSRIVSSTTTENTGRGMSISLLYCLDGDTMVTIRNKETKIEEDISLANLYARLSPNTIVISDMDL